MKNKQHKILFCATGPKIFITHSDLLKNEFVLWQEHNRLLISHPTQTKPFESLFYDIRWRQPEPNRLSGIMEIEGRSFGSWLSGTFWETAERVGQNGPDYGCIHAGPSIGYDIEPGQTVARRGCIVLAKMTPEEFMALYHETFGGPRQLGSA
jgi:hypothetical protein